MLRSCLPWCVWRIWPPGRAGSRTHRRPQSGQAMAEYLVVSVALVFALAGLDTLGVFAWLIDALRTAHRAFDQSLSLPL